MVNNPMADAINNVNVNNIYEIKEDNRPKFDSFGFDDVVYDYDKLLEEQIDLKDVLTLNLFKTINTMNDKLINGRIKDKDAEKIRIDYLKTYINACNSFINLINKCNVNTKYDKNTISAFMDLDNVLIDVNAGANENIDQ